MADDEQRERKYLEDGLWWQQRLDEYVVGCVADSTRGSGFHTSAIVEMQRRQVVAVREFNKKSGRLAGIMIALTIAIGVLAGLQLWAVLQGGG